MYKQTIIRVIATIVVMLTVSINVQAQLGGALKKAADKAVKNTANDMKQSANQTATESVGQATGNAAPSATQQNAKPSAAAIAADPRASITTVEDGYTKSPAAIRAAYEALDANLFFRPYYHPNLRRYYLQDDSAPEQNFFLQSAQTLDQYWSISRRYSGFNEDKIILNFWSETGPYEHFTIVDTIPAGNRTPWGCYDDCIGIMPVGVHVIYSGFALFAADPQGLKPFMRLCEARNAYNAFKGALKVHGGDDGKTLRNRPEKLAVKWEDIAKFQSFLWNLANTCAKQTPMSVIKDAATYYKEQVAKYDAANDARNTRFYFHLFEVAMFFWQESDKKADLAKEMDALFVEYVRYANRYNGWVDADAANAAPIEMPRTYSMSAAVAAKALEVAKNQFENRGTNPFKVDKVVFLTDKWVEGKEPNYPYRVTMRTIEVGVLTNMNGKWVIRQWTLQQRSDMKGGWTDNYLYVAGSNYNPKPVNYKP